MPIKPPPNYRRRRNPLAAATRRAARAGMRDTSPRILSRTPQPTTGSGRIVPQVIRSQPQPTTGAVNHGARKAPPRTLGSAHFKGDVFTGQTGVNRGAGGPNVEAAQATGRVGKKFKVGFTPDGKIVHLYGTDVAAGARRQVLNTPANPTMIRAAQRRARRPGT